MYPRAGLGCVQVRGMAAVAIPGPAGRECCAKMRVQSSPWLGLCYNNETRWGCSPKSSHTARGSCAKNASVCVRSAL